MCRSGDGVVQLVKVPVPWNRPGAHWGPCSSHFQILSVLSHLLSSYLHCPTWKYTSPSSNNNNKNMYVYPRPFPLTFPPCMPYNQICVSCCQTKTLIMLNIVILTDGLQLMFFHIHTSRTHSPWCFCCAPIRYAVPDGDIKGKQCWLVSSHLVLHFNLWWEHIN